MNGKKPIDAGYICTPEKKKKLVDAFEITDLQAAHAQGVTAIAM